VARRRKKTALVPRIVLGASFIAVVPACALTACGGPDPILQLGITFGVAAVAFCCFDATAVADAMFHGVADAAFQLDSTATDGDATLDGDTDDGASDAPDDGPGD
jgi:hypothetical protein